MNLLSLALDCIFWIFVVEIISCTLFGDEFVECVKAVVSWLVSKLCK